jgi:hypothetical protein
VRSGRKRVGRRAERRARLPADCYDDQIRRTLARIDGDGGDPVAVDQLKRFLVQRIADLELHTALEPETAPLIPLSRPQASATASSTTEALPAKTSNAA